MMAKLALLVCLCASSLLPRCCFSAPHIPIGVHPLDEKYYDSEQIKCKYGSRLFSRDQVNDDFCDCDDGTDEPGTSACPNGKFYCRNMGSTPRFLFSSRVNDRICDCCDGSDEYDGGAICQNVCVMGGNIAYKSINIDSSSVSRKAKIEHLTKAPSVPGGLVTLVFLQGGFVLVVLLLRMLCLRKRRARNQR